MFESYVEDASSRESDEKVEGTKDAANASISNPLPDWNGEEEGATGG